LFASKEAAYLLEKETVEATREEAERAKAVILL